MCKLKIFRNLKGISITGCGIPRAGVRRIIHRLCKDFNLPVLLLTDNDTWGYFTYSILKRGLMAPYMTCKYLSIDNLFYAGLKAGDLELLPISKRHKCIRPWKQIWAARLKEMKSYSCFKSIAWCQELEYFEKQHEAITLNGFFNTLGPVCFLQNFLMPRIEQLIKTENASGQSIVMTDE
jgi:DNA topoisomerase-6 subunit A